MARLQKAVASALENEVSDAVKDQEQASIEFTVYEAYSPTWYERRGPEAGGLGDIDNMYSEVSRQGNDIVLSVENRTPPNKFYKHDALKSPFIDEAVEYGHSYEYYNPGSRKFTEDTINELERKGTHIEALRKGLKRQRIKTD